MTTEEELNRLIPQVSASLSYDASVMVQLPDQSFKRVIGILITTFIPNQSVKFAIITYLDGFDRVKVEVTPENVLAFWFQK